jgi:hypothetical protein
MTLRTDWRIEFDGEQYAAQAGGNLPRLLAQPRVQADWQAALAEAADFVRPAAVWDAFPIAQFRHEQLILANGARLGNGPLTTVVAGATHLVIGVCTIGRGLSERISEDQRAGQRLRAMFLDDLGSWAVDQVRQQLCRQVEADATAKGLRASASLSPGESEWSVRDQEVIFSVLDTREIGVTLTESLVMSPLKSLSLVVGIGPGPLGVEGGSNCDFCTIRERCQHRRLRAAVPGGSGRPG